MNKEQALQIIEQALNASVQKGVFNLNDVMQILNALKILNNNE
jgi:hypothetical protein